MKQLHYSLTRIIAIKSPFEGEKQISRNEIVKKF